MVSESHCHLEKPFCKDGKAQCALMGGTEGNPWVLAHKWVAELRLQAFLAGVSTGYPAPRCLSRSNGSRLDHM